MNNTSTFAGFPAEGLAFLADLQENNRRDWFEAHKQEYQALLLEPAVAFVSDLGMKLQAISKNIRYDTRTDGQGVLMRIHRDVRFSPDKSPYKTNISGLFWEGDGKKTESPAFGFQLDSTGMGLMAGIFKFPPKLLSAYRDAVLDPDLGSDLERAVEAVQKLKIYEIEGKHYKRVPAGYNASHPRSPFLQYDGLYAFSPKISASDVLTPQLVNVCYEHFLNMASIQQWLVKIHQE